MKKLLVGLAALVALCLIGCLGFEYLNQIRLHKAIKGVIDRPQEMMRGRSWLGYLPGTDLEVDLMLSEISPREPASRFVHISKINDIAILKVEQYHVDAPLYYLIEQFPEEGMELSIYIRDAKRARSIADIDDIIISLSENIVGSYSGK